MARRKLKLTGFARFFMVMLFLVPLAYIGASYYNGQDGIQNIKDFLGIGKNQQTTEQVDRNREVRDQVNRDVQTLPETTATDRSNNGASSLESRRLDQIEMRMNQLERENIRLREQVNQLESKVLELQQ